MLGSSLNPRCRPRPIGHQALFLTEASHMMGPHLAHGTMTHLLDHSVDRKSFLGQDSFRSIQDISNLVSPATKGLRQLKLRVTGQGYAWFCIAYQKSLKCAYYTHV